MRFISRITHFFSCSRCARSRIAASSSCTILFPEVVKIQSYWMSCSSSPWHNMLELLTQQCESWISWTQVGIFCNTRMGCDLMWVDDSPASHQGDASGRLPPWREHLPQTLQDPRCTLPPLTMQIKQRENSCVSI
jgi:hypothetical protein